MNIRRYLPLLPLTLFAVLSFRSGLRESVTYDEPIHIATGYVYWHTGSYHMEPSHPPFVRLLAAVPLLLERLRFPIYPQMSNYKTFRLFSNAFLNHNRIASAMIVNSARLMMVILSLILGLTVLRWSEKLFGSTAALVAVTAFSFCPPLLAYSHLVMTDIGAATTSTIALYLFWKFWQDRSPRRLLQAGLGLGLAFSTKFSEVLLLPILAGIIFYLNRVEPEKRRLSMDRKTFQQAAVYLLTAAGVVLLFYRVTESFNLLRGLWELTHAMTSGWPHYFHGHYQAGAWKWFLLATFLLKTPLPFLILVALGLVLAFQNRFPHRTAAIAWLLIPCAIYLGFASMSSFQIGVRRILLLYPLLSIWIGGTVVTLWRSGRFGRWLVSGLGVWYIAGAVIAYPNYLSYLNESVGGSSQGYRYFADCNVDLGQGFEALADYLKDEGVATIYLSAFGAIDPHDYGIRYVPIASSTFYDLPGDPVDFRHEKKVLFVISETNKTGNYYPDHHQFDWLESREPVKVLMNSIWVYDITHDSDAHRQFAKILRASGQTDYAQQEDQYAASPGR